MTELAERIVDMMNSIHGTHSGFRAVHAKGACCRGSFKATREAAAVCIAPHLQGEDVAVTVRFSSGSGKPTRADGARDERGMAVKFHLPDGSTTDIVSLTLPVFFVKTPDDFLEFLTAQQLDPETGKPDLARVAAFVDTHPEAQLAMGFLMFSMSPASFAACTFNGIHAFRMSAPDGTSRFVRYKWVPESTPPGLTDEETRALGKSYLHDELVRRLEGGSVSFELELQIAAEGDDPNDPTTPWPEEREVVRAGTMTLREHAADSCDGMIFDPGRVIDGIERSDDPILHARSDAYSVSFARRTKG
ncbi:MAG TPA: catalase family peroxidase [Actinomycetota bacterium]|nr:catalase family peroxidase [Actinomycetota bacterium]